MRVAVFLCAFFFMLGLGAVPIWNLMIDLINSAKDRYDY